jgi:hypothetical protein
MQSLAETSTLKPANTLSVTSTADRIGMTGSLICALHCALTPLVLSLVPTLGLGLLTGIDLDQAFVVFASLLGLATLGLGFRQHRVHHAWMLLLPGLALVWAGSFTSLHDHSAAHAVVMAGGGLLIAAAHLFNLRLSHRAAEISLARRDGPERG